MVVESDKRNSLLDFDVIYVCKKFKATGFFIDAKSPIFGLGLLSQGILT